jgi:hypothetical protein
MGPTHDGFRRPCKSNHAPVPQSDPCGRQQQQQRVRAGNSLTLPENYFLIPKYLSHLIFYINFDHLFY